MNLHYYDPETKTYSNYIPVNQFEQIQAKLKTIEARLQTLPVNKAFDYSSEEVLDIDSIPSLTKLLENKNFRINSSVNKRRASLFLVACYFCSEVEPLAFLLKQGVEINHTDMFGYNAIMSLIMNENMSEDKKLKALQMLIDNGCDVNWLNYQCEHALYLALQTMQLDVVNLLIDCGACDYEIKS